MRRQRRTIGAVIEIDLKDGFYSYGRVLDYASFGIYDIHTNKKIDSLVQIVKSPLLFIIAAYNDVVTKGRWIKIGTLPLPDSLQILPMQFIQDGLDPSKFRLYNPNTGVMLPAIKSECKGLERAAVWEAGHVEDRIRDHFANRPCIWLKEDLEVFD